MVKKFQAIMDRVLIRLDEGSNKQGNVLLPDDFHRQRTTGIVESVGDQVKSVFPGDRVFFHVFEEISTLDPDLVVVRERSLLGVFKN